MVSMTPVRAQPHYIPPPGKIKTPRGPRVLRRRPRALRVARQARGVLLFGLSLLCACAAGPRLELVAGPMQPGVTLAEGGVRLTLLPNAWSAYPSDLSRYYTPLEVQIDNLLAEEVQVRYEDFLALDDANRQYRAVPPGEVARAMSGSLRLWAGARRTRSDAGGRPLVSLRATTVGPVLWSIRALAGLVSVFLPLRMGPAVRPEHPDSRPAGWPVAPRRRHPGVPLPAASDDPGQPAH